MPKLLVSKPAKKSPMPPCGRRRKFVAPHSPFQRLVDQARMGLDMSTRDVAGGMTKLKAKTDQSTFWVWLHNESGHPSPRSFTTTHLKALCRVLKLQEPEVRKALDESRAIYTGRPEPTPRPQLEGLITLKMVLERSKGVMVKRATILHLVKSLIAGAEVEPPAEKPARPHRKTK